MKKGFKKGNNRPSWRRTAAPNTDPTDDAQSEERHKGSYDYDTLCTEDIYKSRVEWPDAVKRKYAVCFGYLGSSFQGLQINPGAHTVEAELEKALFLSGAIQDSNYGYMGKIQWTRAARTDRGVHAAVQCCAMKLLIPLDRLQEFVRHVNGFLPPTIHVHTLTKVSKNFNSKMNCSKRRYQYYMPTYCLTNVDVINTLLTAAFEKQGPIEGAGYEGGYVPQLSKASLNAESASTVRQSLLKHRIDRDKLQLLREVLALYVGTKSYHNFTSDKLPTDATAQRYIISFSCSEPKICDADGSEWVLLEVVGQSFLLNQIRRMVGLAIDITRKAAPIEAMKFVFSNKKVDIPTAPAVSLYLGELFFDGYNMKQRSQNANEQRLLKKRQSESRTTCDLDSVVETSSKSSLPNVSLSSINAGQEQATAVPPSTELKEEQASKRLKVERPTDACSSSFATNAEESQDVKKVIENAHAALASSAASEDQQQLIVHEEIDWSDNSEIRSAITSFEESVIHPHIIAQDTAEVSFMYYLDFLRTYPRSYAARDFSA